MKVGGRPAGPLNTLLLGFLVLTQKTKVSIHTNFCGIIRVIFILKFVDDKERTQFAMKKRAYSIIIQIKVVYLNEKHSVVRKQLILDLSFLFLTAFACQLTVTCRKLDF